MTSDIMPIFKEGLCDERPEVSRAAYDSFIAMESVIQEDKIDHILPVILEMAHDVDEDDI